MKIKTTLIAASTTLLIMACGAPETQDKEETTGTPDTGPQIESDFDTDQTGTVEDAVDDTELAGQTITSQIDSAISDLAEEASITATGSGLSLTSLELEGELRRHRECNAAEDTAVVDITHSFAGSWEFEGLFRKGSVDVSFAGEVERTWSRDDGAITCHESGLYADVPVGDMAGVNLAVTFSRKKERTSTLTNKLKDRTGERTMKFEANGTRNIKWDAVTEAETGYEIERTVNSSVQRKLQIANKSGDLRLIENDISIAEDAPLKTTLVRDLSTLAPLSRTIHSGMVTATGKNGGRIETTFNEVTWSLAGGCMAVSGSIDGAIYKSGEDEPAKTFSIEFSEDDKTITFDDGSTFDYTPDGCDLDKVSTVKDVADPSEVSADADNIDGTDNTELDAATDDDAETPDSDIESDDA